MHHFPSFLIESLWYFCAEEVVFCCSESLCYSQFSLMTLRGWDWSHFEWNRWHSSVWCWQHFYTTPVLLWQTITLLTTPACLPQRSDSVIFLLKHLITGNGRPHTLLNWLFELLTMLLLGSSWLPMLYIVLQGLPHLISGGDTFVPVFQRAYLVSHGMIMFWSLWCSKWLHYKTFLASCWQLWL